MKYDDMLPDYETRDARVADALRVAFSALGEKAEALRRFSERSDSERTRSDISECFRAGRIYKSALDDLRDALNGSGADALRAERVTLARMERQRADAGADALRSDALEALEVQRARVLRAERE